MSEHWDNLVELATRTLDDQDVWGEFWTQLRPEVERWLRNPRFLGRISQREDYMHDIVLLIWEKLQARDLNKLRAFLDKLDEPSPGESASDNAPSGRRFHAWMRRVCKNIGIDFMRTLPEFRRRGGDRKQSGPDKTDTSEARWRSVVTLGTGVGAVRDPVTMQNLARQMLEFLDDAMPQRQRQIAQLRGQGVGAVELARTVGLEAKDIDVVARRAHDRMHYRSVVELWSQGLSTAEIATELTLVDSAHAYRLLNAAKQLLRRRFQV